MAAGKGPSSTSAGQVWGTGGVIAGELSGKETGRSGLMPQADRPAPRIRAASQVRAAHRPRPTACAACETNRTTPAATPFEALTMTLLLLEALAALLILLFIVWWTMFSGRRKGELPTEAEREKEQMRQAAADADTATDTSPPKT